VPIWVTRFGFSEPPRLLAGCCMTQLTWPCVGVTMPSGWRCPWFFASVFPDWRYVLQMDYNIVLRRHCCLSGHAVWAADQWRTLTFMDGEISWVGGCLGGWLFCFLQMLSQDWVGLNMSNLAQIWHLVRGWSALLDFWKKLIVAKFAKKSSIKIKKQQKRAHSCPHTASQTKNSRNVEIGTNVACAVWILPKVLVFKIVHCFYI